MDTGSDRAEEVLPTDPADRTRRAPYVSPRLIVYGDVRTLTSGGKGITDDGGAMFTHM